MKRRTFLSLLGAAPIAGKAAADAEIAKATGIWTADGLGNASMGLIGGIEVAPPSTVGENIAYEKRLTGAADYIKAFGLPEVVRFELQDRAKYVSALDPDIACKRSWSMAVKIMTQRERNFEREVKRMEMSGWQQRKKSLLKGVLGFDWPW